MLAWVGSNARSSAAGEVDGVLARRQPGSTLKPFVYELAFEKRLITPASLLDDSPAQIATAAGLYLPQNYDREWKGFVSARTALGASLNVPAVRVAGLLGPDALHQRLRALGFALPESAGWYGASLALGSADVSLLALTNAYRALANGGLYSPAVLRSGGAAARPVRVADPAAVFLVTDILADNNARARTFGLASALATRGFAAVKTGTSKDMRDNWCIGFTDRYTIGVWVGNASGEAMHSVSGVSGAAPVWQALASALHAGAVSRPPLAPRRRRPAAGGLRQRQGAGARRGLPRRQRTRPAARHGRGRRRAPLRHHQPARRQRVRDRSRHSAGGAAHHLRRRARQVGARRQAAGQRRALALGAVAGAAPPGARRRRQPGAAERELRSARRRSQAAGGDARAEAKAGPAASRRPQP